MSSDRSRRLKWIVQRWGTLRSERSPWQASPPWRSHWISGWCFCDLLVRRRLALIFFRNFRPTKAYPIGLPSNRPPTRITKHPGLWPSQLRIARRSTSWIRISSATWRRLWFRCRIWTRFQVQKSERVTISNKVYWINQWKFRVLIPEQKAANATEENRSPKMNGVSVDLQWGIRATGLVHISSPFRQLRTVTGTDVHNVHHFWQVLITNNLIQSNSTLKKFEIFEDLSI